MLDLSASSHELLDTDGAFPSSPWHGENEKHLIENYHEHLSLQPFSRMELHALAFPSDCLLALTLEEEIADFQESGQAGLKLPPMVPFHRRIASDCARRHGLEAISMGNGCERHVVILKTEDTVVTPLLQYTDALPCSMSKDKLHMALGYKKKASTYTTGYVSVTGQIMDCRVLTEADSLKPFHASKQDSDRSDWMRFVNDTVRKGLPIATHAHIVEVRVENPKNDVGQFAELQRFLGPFHVRWVGDDGGDDRGSGVGVIVYPSVPSANNCLDRFEDEDDPDSTLPFKLYPFAPYVFGPFIDDQSTKRFRHESGASTPMGRSPSSTGGSWRDGNSYMDRYMGGGGGRWGATPPLAPKDNATSPPLHYGKSGSWSPAQGTPGLSPGIPPKSPATSGISTPNVQPLSLGRGKWLEVKGGRHHDPEGRSKSPDVSDEKVTVREVK
eukprot:TRINITY_DN2931_c0_g1_i1.p1 TRINITY_DN2931_c0_g1~~TRINITY_DN2931_c0_g1_i1.p1  ORF type:complete len:442 (+),score=109.13 TRINITY_DN2931_c0_g1_i1:1500-2825(+)